MKVILYRRFVSSNMHVHWFVDDHIIYIPSKKVALVREKSSTFGSLQYRYIDEKTHKTMIEEAKQIKEAKDYNLDTCKITDVKITSLNDKVLNSMIKSAKKYNSILDSLTTYFETLFDKNLLDEN